MTSERRNIRKFLLVAVVAVIAYLASALLPVRAAVVELQDSQGKTAWLYVPRRVDPKKTYWLVVGVHGLGGDGRGAAGLAAWADQKDVLVLGPTFVDGYQGGNDVHEAKLLDLVKQVGERHRLHDRIFLHGFSAGAQFAHRFSLRNPTRVAGVSAHSGGSWDKPNAAAASVVWAVSCGAADTEKSAPQLPLNRIDGFRAFAAALKELKCDVEARELPGIDHRQTPTVMQMATACFDRARKAAAKKN
jgi:poly(3-hydroxybutyrate) depolymerase